MSRPEEIASIIRSLSAPDPTLREQAAAAAFQQGREMARPAVVKWLANQQSAHTFILNESHFPQSTVGLAVSPENFDLIRIANGSPRLADVPPDQDAKEYELHFPSGVQLDILTSEQPEGRGAIARFLQKFGEGIQQVELLVRDVDQATKILREQFGVEAVYPATRPGADGTRVNFFLAAAPQGKKVLIELVEAAAKSKAED